MAANDLSSRQQTRRIKDARVRKVAQLDPVALYLLHRHDGGIPREVLRELTQEIGIGKLAESRLRLWGGGVAFACVLLLLGSALTQLIKGNMPFAEFVQRALWYQGIWIVPPTFWIAARRSRFHRIRQIMLDHLRCPHCGYDLRSLPADPADGATVCPECGCARKLGNSGAAQQGGSDERE